MIKKMDRKKNESYLSFSKRVTRALSNKTISYKEWAKSLLNENIYGEENTRRCFVFFEKFLSILENSDKNNLKISYCSSSTYRLETNTLLLLNDSLIPLNTNFEFLNSSSSLK